MSKQSIIIAVIIVIFVGIITGYIIYKNVTNDKIEESSDEISVFLKDIEKATNLDFSDPTDTEFSWMIEEEGEIKEIVVMGKQIEVKNILGSETAKISDFFNMEPDIYNIADGTVSGLVGFKKIDIVCIVVRRLCGEESCDNKTCISEQDFANDRNDVVVKCGRLNLELEPIAIEEIIEPKEIKVSKNNNFVINLEANLSTGYQWKPNFDYNYVELIGIDYQSANNGVLGSSGTEVFTFRPLQEGETELIFSYSRPWEDKAPIKKAVYKLTIE